MTSRSHPSSVDVITEYFAAIRAGDVERWVATFAPQAVCIDPSGPPILGHDALRQFFLGVTAAFDQLTIQADQVFPVGRAVAVKWSAQGIGKNRREIAFDGIDVFELDREGKIERLQAYWDPARIMAQLQACS